MSFLTEKRAWVESNTRATLMDITELYQLTVKCASDCEEVHVYDIMATLEFCDAELVKRVGNKNILWKVSQHYHNAVRDALNKRFT